MAADARAAQAQAQEIGDNRRFEIGKYVRVVHYYEDKSLVGRCGKVVRVEDYYPRSHEPSVVKIRFFGWGETDIIAVDYLCPFKLEVQNRNPRKDDLVHLHRNDESQGRLLGKVIKTSPSNERCTVCWFEPMLNMETDFSFKELEVVWDVPIHQP